MKYSDFSILAVLFFFIIVLFSACDQPQDEWQGTIEEVDGVTVVKNPISPYEVKGEPSELVIEEEFSIDTEKDEIAEIGLVDIIGFDIDSEGIIYVYQNPERYKGHLVYRFDSRGIFSNSFGIMGQGPGEIESPNNVNIFDKNEIQIQDDNKSKLLFFNGQGDLIRETKISLPSTGITILFPLRNNNYLSSTDIFDVSSKHRFDVLELYDSQFQKLKELDRCDYGLLIAASQSKKVGSPFVFIHQINNEKIFVGHENRGYEILVFDLDGSLQKKIQKQFESANPPQAFIELLLINMGPYKDRIIVPKKMPPFHNFFLDDAGRLYVKTYEKGENENEYIHDIFNPDGIFIARKSMPSFDAWMKPGARLNGAKAKNGQFYCIREKESGYKELVVYKMIWQ